LFYHRDTVAGDIVPDEIIDGFDTHQHIVGTIHHVEFIDDRWRDGVPHRVVTLLQPPKPPEEPEPGQIRTDMVAVLDGPTVDHGDGRGAVVAQADFLAGLIEVLVGGRLRRRISSEFDADGKEYWVRQIAVGHENDPEVGWGLIQVPDFKTFDPIEAGVVSADIDQDSPEYFAGYQLLVYDYYIEQASHILELPKKELKKFRWSTDRKCSASSRRWETRRVLQQTASSAVIPSAMGTSSQAATR